MRFRDWWKDWRSCPKAFGHAWHWQWWSIGNINRGQAEAHDGWRCYHCGKIRFASQNRDGSFEFKTRKQCRAEFQQEGAGRE